MAKYQLTKHGVLNRETGGHIPSDPKNAHYRAFLEWASDPFAGNVPDPIAAPEPETAEIGLDKTDKAMIRAVDWLLEYLVINNVIPMNDIPGPLKALYIQRKDLRNG